ncbi:uncharacterized protein BDFB_000310, partial [Asbolus verrucosus]
MAAHQCYACGPEEELDCNNFDPNNKSFIKECPPNTSCEIKAYGNTLERSCSEMMVQDCKIANKIRYCYCVMHLCNDKMNFSDDEDLTEGSGIPVNPVIINTNQNEQQKTSNLSNQSNHIQFCLYSTYISILALLCN